MLLVYRISKKHFYPRPPRGGRPFTPFNYSCCIKNFYPRPPRGGRPTYKHVRTAATIISIHALREEGDPEHHDASRTDLDFYPRPPRGGRLCDGLHHHFHRTNFYPRPPRGGRLSDVVKQRVDFLISIHALREEGDVQINLPTAHLVISIHALREEGDSGMSV